MPAVNLLSALRQHPFVETFLPAHIDRLQTLAREVAFERDQTIFREGDDTHEFFLIVTGRVALEIIEPDHLLRVQTLGAGDEFVELVDRWPQFVADLEAERAVPEVVAVVAVAGHAQIEN